MKITDMRTPKEGSLEYRAMCNSPNCMVDGKCGGRPIPHRNSRETQ